MAVICFRDFDAVRAALGRGVIPPAIAAAAVRWDTDELGRVWLDAAGLTRSVAAALQRLGARVQGESEIALERTANQWPEILPLLQLPPDFTRRVLFMLPASVQLAGWMAELRRLGHQASWQLTDGDRALIWVDAPPLFTLLRTTDSGATVFVEQSPRMWVEWGYRHPLDVPAQPPSGAAILIRPAHAWETVSTNAGSTPRRWRMPGTAAPRPPAGEATIPIHLSLTDAATSVPEFWVLPGGWDDLKEWVAATDDGLIERLLAAGITAGGRREVIVAARPNRDGPPALMFDAPGYRPYLKLPNLFLPIGRGLSPLLRRDAARRHLAAKSGYLNWLRARPNGGMARATLPMAALRPLPQQIRYVPPVTRALQAEVASPVLPVDSFVTRDRPAARLRPVTPPADIPAQSGVWRSLFSWVRGAWRLTPAPPAEAAPQAAPAGSKPDDPPQRSAVDDSPRPFADLEQQVIEAVRTGHAIEPTLWRQLARAYHSAGQCADAALCWQQVLWEQDGSNADDVRGWWLAECGAGAGRPAQSGVRAAAAATVLATAAVPAAVDDARALINQFEPALTARAAWLSQLALTRATGDVVGLARAHDRLFERLLRDGLRVDQDILTILRRPNGGPSNRGESMRRWLPRGRDLARRWLIGRAGSGDEPAAPQLQRYGLARERIHTPAYADLLFAWGLARYGEREAAGELASQAANRLPSERPVHAWLAAAFQERIGQAAAGQLRPRPLTETLRNALASLDFEARVAVDRFRAASRVLEDTDLVNPYDSVAAPDPLAALADAFDAADINRRVNELLRRVRPTPAARVPVIGAGLQLAPRGGATLTQALLARLVKEFDPPTNDAVQFEAAAHGLMAAAAVGLAEPARHLAARLGKLMTRSPAATPAFIRFLDAAVHALRRLELRDELATLAARVDAADQPAEPDRFVRLALAAAWLTLGNDDRAVAELDAVRSVLFAPDGSNPAAKSLRQDLSLAYVGALAAAPARLALGRLEELFARLPVPVDSFSSNAYFALAPLRLIEAVVRAVVDDSAGLDPLTRRWLDEDELRVRSRIRRDLDAILARQSP